MKRIPYILLALIVLTGCKPTKIVEVEFPARQPDPNQVAQLLDEEKRQLAGYEPGGVEKAVLEAYTGFNQKTVGEEHSRAELEEDIKRIRVASKLCLEQGGQKQLTKLITWLLIRFEKSLKELLAVAKSKKAVAALLSGSKPPEEIKEKFEEFIKLGGDFIQNAYNAGLLRPGKKDGIELTEGGEFFIRLAFKVRWAMILPEATRPLSWLLTSFESKWYDIWTVERSKTAPLARKLKAIIRLKKRNPAYRDHFARGVVYYRHEDYPKSLRSFDRALKQDPEDQLIKAFKQAAERRL